MSNRLTDDGLMGFELELTDPGSDPADDESTELDDPTAFCFDLNELEMELGLEELEDLDSGVVIM
jgi:hypothetical protein